MAVLELGMLYDPPRKHPDRGSTTDSIRILTNSKGEPFVQWSHSLYLDYGPSANAVIAGYLEDHGLKMVGPVRKEPFDQTYYAVCEWV